MLHCCSCCDRRCGGVVGSVIELELSTLEVVSISPAQIGVPQTSHRAIEEQVESHGNELPSERASDASAVKANECAAHRMSMSGSRRTRNMIRLAMGQTM